MGELSSLKYMYTTPLARHISASNKAVLHHALLATRSCLLSAASASGASRSKLDQLRCPQTPYAVVSRGWRAVRAVDSARGVGQEVARTLAVCIHGLGGEVHLAPICRVLEVYT